MRRGGKKETKDSIEQGKEDIILYLSLSYFFIIMTNLSGILIDKCYFFEKKIGSGKTGEVYKVLKKGNFKKKDEYFAFKRYKEWVLNEKNQPERIAREFKIGKTINSKYVVKTYDILKKKQGFFLLMEFLEGETLEKIIKPENEVDFETIKNIIIDISQGLKEIHEKQLIHRDIKPANIMITDENAVIMDLGVLKDINMDTTTVYGKKFIGTIKYAAPEYLFGERYDKSIDIYSLGLILFELIFSKKFCDKFWTEDILLHDIIRKNGIESYIPSFYYLPIRFSDDKRRFLWLLLMCILERKEKRISLEEVIQAFSEDVWHNISLWDILETQNIYFRGKFLNMKNFIAIKDIEYEMQDEWLFNFRYNSSEFFPFDLKVNDGYIIKLRINESVKILRIPDSIKFCSNLQSLELCYNKNLKKLSLKIHKLEKLKELFLIANSIDELPPNFKNIPNLKRLYLSVASFKDHPKKKIFLPRSLNELIIIDSKAVGKININFEDLRRLRKLVIISPFLKELPPNITTIKTLKILSFSSNKCICLPESIDQLINLKKISLSLPKLKKLPINFYNLSKLETFDLKNNFRYGYNIRKKIDKLNISIRPTLLKPFPKKLLNIKSLNKIKLGYTSISDSLYNEFLKRKIHID